MKHVVIIGAGPAGLTAAYELLREPGAYQITILEESGAIGGISRTVRHGGNRMDIGGHRFFSKDDRVTAWWSEVFPDQGAPAMDDRLLGRDVPLHEGGPDPDKTDEVMLTRRRISRIYYRRKFFDYPVRLNAATICNMGLPTTVRAGCSYLAACAHKLPEDSLENFYINRFGRTLYSMFFQGYTEKLWGRPPREISADWGAQRVKGLSIRAILKDVLRKLTGGSGEVETSLIESFRYPKLGPGQLWESVAGHVQSRGGELIMNAAATDFAMEDGRITAVNYVQGGERKSIPADVVISTMPVKDLVRGLPSAPQNAREIAEGLPYRDFVTVGLLVDRLAIRNRTKLRTLSDLVPDCWIYVQDPGVTMGRIQIFNNWSPYMVRDPEHTVWLGLEYFCAEGDDMWRRSDDDWARCAADELRRMGILAGETQPADFHVERVKKAYPAYFDTYARMDELRAYLDTIGNLYCIGRNGQHRYNNMDHSMATAFEAVRCIQSGSEDKSPIWNVNTDKSYHEEKDA
ncbi:MAG: NAD(P)/FAD-dependent oxidoreductase [Candidatus Ventricola sp.]